MIGPNRGNGHMTWDKLLCTGVPELLKLISNVLAFPAKLTRYLWQLLHKRWINAVLYVVCKGPNNVQLQL